MHATTVVSWGIYPNCTKQLEVCDECGDRHNTKFHERVQERMRSNKA